MGCLSHTGPPGAAGPSPRPTPVCSRNRLDLGPECTEAWVELGACRGEQLPRKLALELFQL